MPARPVSLLLVEDDPAAIQVMGRMLALAAQLQRLAPQAAATLAAEAAEVDAAAQRRDSGPLEPRALHELIALLRTHSLSAMERFRAARPWPPW